MKRESVGIYHCSSMGSGIGVEASRAFWLGLGSGVALSKRARYAQCLQCPDSSVCMGSKVFDKKRDKCSVHYTSSNCSSCLIRTDLPSEGRVAILIT
jgi:hypothetical protein